jgi:glycerol-3-phosphate dehydrogenase
MTDAATPPAEPRPDAGAGEPLPPPPPRFGEGEPASSPPPRFGEGVGGRGCLSRMNRAALLEQALARREPWDLIVIGGGATGAGIALDAATRGYAVLLLERHDFGKGTSSRSTKLVHGGVRYLAQGNIGLVREALHERGLLLKNAPHVVHDLAFVVPAYRWWDRPFYGLGLTLYDLLAGRHRIGRSRKLSKAEALARIPTLRPDGLRGGIVYHDGQFDDARLLIDILVTAADHGATVLNYAPVTGLLSEGGRVTGVVARDEETGRELRATARVVINATGAFCDGVRHLADPAAAPLVSPSQGTHVVLDHGFLPGDSALLVPKTPDGRVLFAIPWHGHTLVGTTDVSIPAVSAEPRPTAQEIDFILGTAGRYLAKPPTRADVLSTWAGIRPLVKATGVTRTATLSREHTIHTDRPGLVTITGGKWTTYRAMAEDCMNLAAELGGLPKKPCLTAERPIRGPDTAGGGERLHPALPYTADDVTRSARSEMARTVEDVLSRRTRALMLNAAAAVEMAPRVAALLAAELSREDQWAAEQVRTFNELAKGYSV